MIYNLSPSGLRQRIVNIFGKSINSRLINIDCATGLVDIKGFICSPEQARKTYGEQYFFVNNRFMKHPFFHKAVTEAYSGLIGVDCIPSYFIYFTVDPSLIDINIHPTKTEIKFQNETDFFQILLAGIKEALGKFNITPPLDFDTAGSIELIPTRSQQPPMFRESTIIRTIILSITAAVSLIHRIRISNIPVARQAVFTRKKHRPTGISYSTA